MDIKEQIIKVNEYFKNKVLEGDYKIVGYVNACIVNIIIDDKYNFELWNNGLPSLYFGLYQFDKDNPMYSGLFFDNETDRMLAYNRFKPMFDEYERNILTIEKQEQISKLQKELENLNK